MVDRSLALTPPDGPLAGIRVLELTEVWAGPIACSILGDMGAEVIKVESIQRFPTARGYGPVNPRPGPLYPNMMPGERPFNRSASYNGHNRNKLGITLDLKNPRGRAIYFQLVRQADLIVENYAPHVMGQLGVDYEQVRKVRPDIIMLSMAPYGLTGPYRDHTTYGFTIDGACGHASLRGYAGRDFSEVDPAFPADVAAAHVGVFALLTALHYRNRTGQGQYIDLSQCENFAIRLGEFMLEYAMNGRVPTAIGNRDTSAAPQGVYKCKGGPAGPPWDKWVALSVTTDAQWQALARLIGRPDLLADRRFRTAAGRWRFQAELDPPIAAWASQHTDYEAMQQLQAVGIAAQAVLDAAEILVDPHLAARNHLPLVDHPAAGQHPYVGMPWRMSRHTLGIRRPGNLLGEHNAVVLGDLLGLTPEELEALQAEQVIGDQFLPGSDR